MPSALMIIHYSICDQSIRISASFSRYSKRIDAKNRSIGMSSGSSGLCAPTQIRTGVLALKGLRPGPLDDGGKPIAPGFYHCIQRGSSLSKIFRSSQIYRGMI